MASLPHGSTTGFHLCVYDTKFAHVNNNTILLKDQRTMINGGFALFIVAHFTLNSPLPNSSDGFVIHLSSQKLQ